MKTKVTFNKQNFKNYPIKGYPHQQKSQPKKEYQHSPMRLPVYPPSSHQKINSINPLAEPYDPTYVHTPTHKQGTIYPIAQKTSIATRKEFRPLATTRNTEHKSVEKIQNIRLPPSGTISKQSRLGARPGHFPIHRKPKMPQAGPLAPIQQVSNQSSSYSYSQKWRQFPSEYLPKQRIQELAYQANTRLKFSQPPKNKSDGLNGVRSQDIIEAYSSKPIPYYGSKNSWFSNTQLQQRAAPSNQNLQKWKYLLMVFLALIAIAGIIIAIVYAVQGSQQSTKGIDQAEEAAKAHLSSPNGWLTQSLKQVGGGIRQHLQIRRHNIGPNIK